MITLADVERRVADLADAGEYSADGHLEEDAIREDALKAIAAGAPDAAALAAAALRTGEHGFPRWYE